MASTVQNLLGVEKAAETGDCKIGIAVAFQSEVK